MRTALAVSAAKNFTHLSAHTHTQTVIHTYTWRWANYITMCSDSDDGLSHKSLLATANEKYKLRAKLKQSRSSKTESRRGGGGGGEVWSKRE